ncbi:ketohexokinase [Biomphalaria glabrata]|nr:ketohexokinase [Biomphalaria glabrata]
MMFCGGAKDKDDQNVKPQKHVLCIGMACVDFVNIVKEFPLEDSDQRIQDYYWQRGGNASNNCTVLSLLSIPCEFMGVLGTEGVEASWILKDFESFNINTEHCVIKDVHCPVGTIILNMTNGTRTILFFPRDRPEMLYEDFQLKFKKDFSAYSWIHFELCSNVLEISKMIDDVLCYRNSNGQPVVSIEIEKPEFHNYNLVINKADLVFVSKDYAKSKGFANAKEAVSGLYNLCKEGAILVCAWGEQGASLCINNEVLTCPALQNIKVVDTLGAGDTFVAGFVGSLLSQRFYPTEPEHTTKIITKLEYALNYACHLAGLKCSMYGYTGLKDCYKCIDAELK